MNNFVTESLGEICSKVKGDIRTGPFGSQLHESDYSEFGIPVVMPKNIIEGRITENDIARVKDAHVERLLIHKLNIGDIVYGRRGDIGRRAIVTQKELGWLCGTGCLRLSLQGNILNTKYLYYYLGQDTVIAWIKGQAIGATMPNLNTSILKSVKIAYPPLPIQRKIAAVLSAYDDLIENNNRRIKILEEMAQNLYREWFVKFRFPGHEQARFQDSSLGRIPAGWEVRKIGDVAEITGGGTPSTNNAEFWNKGTVNWYSPTDLTRHQGFFIDESSKKITEQGLSKSSARLFPAYSVMMTSRATLGVIAINTKAACTNQGFITCIPNDDLHMYEIYYWLEENKDEMISRASGATFKEITKTNFREYLITLPNWEIKEKFIEQVDPILRNVEKLLRKNANLRRTRDLLLPRLISGELDVEDLDIDVAGLEA